jgi:predicted ester cyclase
MVDLMRNEDVVRGYVDAFNAADWEKMPSLFAGNAVIRGVLGWGTLDFAIPIWRDLHDNMQMRLRLDDLIVADGKAAALFTETGTFSGPFRGLPGIAPTGKRYEIVAMEWFQFEGARIARRWGARDSTAITRQVSG